jgi:hypothetical protein
MHGKQYAQELKEAAEIRRETVSSHAAEFQILLPADQYAVFCSEPIASTTFTVANSYPHLAEVQNSSAVPFSTR